MSLVSVTTRSNQKPITIAAHTIEQVQENPDGKGGATVRCKNGARFSVAEDVPTVTKAWKAAGGATAPADEKPKAEKPKAPKVK